MTSIARGRLLATALMSAAIVSLAARSVAAQGASAPDTGRISVAAGMDVPSVYFFRGIRQEQDPELTLWPSGLVGLRLYSGQGRVRRASASVSAWNTLHTGSSGSGGGSGQMYYEADFSGTASLAFARGVNLGATFVAYTTPNESFRRVRELSLTASTAGRVAPYGIIAFELSGQADGGLNEGTYLELGVGPNWSFSTRNATLTIPLKVGLSLHDFYEGRTGDETFGFAGGGAHVTLPLNRRQGRLGSWNIHGGVDVLMLGETTKALNNGDAAQIVVVGGVGLTY